MAKFIYRMQNILNIKYKLEDQAKNEFMLANRILQEEEEKKEKLLIRKASYQQEAKELLAKRLDVFRIRENKEAILRMEEYIREQDIVIQRAQEEVEEKAAALAALRQERKAQEKLKEKAFDSFIREENAKESKEIDELVSFTYGKKQKLNSRG
ncbi:MAG: flagellar export protein FliJ [Lachnospiraceae bacterium]|nr:flagellar export protein FliJ [Lachnospiraceae bacterium]MDD7049673.1 flagellar export protein FliJ [Lachnospiraceae bacterium]MDY4096731.1 flagellar export protein FliJ [Lachnospiraceae bacterium]